MLGKFAPRPRRCRIDIKTGKPGFVDCRRYRIDFTQMMTFACESGLLSATRGVLCGYRENLSSQVGPDTCLSGGAPDRWQPIPPAALLPVDTTPASLQAERGSPFQAPEIGETPCHSASRLARVTGVQNFTSLRNDPSQQHQRVAELPLGREYLVNQAPAADFRHPRNAACKLLCKDAEFGRPYDAAALKSCIDSNWPWFKIEGVGPNGGYASAKYLDY